MAFIETQLIPITTVNILFWCSNCYNWARRSLLKRSSLTLQCDPRYFFKVFLSAVSHCKSKFIHIFFSPTLIHWTGREFLFSMVQRPPGIGEWIVLLWGHCSDLFVHINARSRKIYLQEQKSRSLLKIIRPSFIHFIHRLRHYFKSFQLQMLNQALPLTIIVTPIISCLFLWPSEATICDNFPQVTFPM